MGKQKIDSLLDFLLKEFIKLSDEKLLLDGSFTSVKSLIDKKLAPKYRYEYENKLITKLFSLGWERRTQFQWSGWRRFNPEDKFRLEVLRITKEVKKVETSKETETF